MNRSLRAAGGALATAVIAIAVLVVVALVDPQATAVSSDHHDTGSTLVAAAGVLQSPSPVPWQRLDKQLGELENRIDVQARRRDDDVESTRRRLTEFESRFQADADRVPDEAQLLETIKTTLAQSGDQQRLASIETRLKTLTGTIEQKARETATLRKAIERLQPVLEVSVDSLRPDHFTIAARRVPLVDVLKRLETLSDWKFETTGAATAMVTIDRLEGVTLEQALEVLLPVARCAARLEGRQVSVMSLAEARSRRDRAPVSSTIDAADSGLPGQFNDSGDVVVREVILDVTMASVELTDECPGGIGDLVEKIDSPGRSDGGVLLQSSSEFLEQLAGMVSIRILARPRLRVVAGGVARLETASVRPQKRDGRTRLEMRPRILSDNRIQLDITPSAVTVVSDVDEQSRSSTARAVLVSGRTVLFGGLAPEVIAIPSAVTDQPDSQQPRLLERLFGSDNEPVPVVTTRRQLIVLVTPRLVDQQTGEPLR